MATITGTGNNETLKGTDGDDVVYGLGGSDTLKGEMGNDRLYGGPGDDLLDGGPKKNLRWNNGAAGDFDVAVYDDLSAAITLNLSSLQVTGATSGSDKLFSVEQVIGTGGSDRVIGALGLISPTASDFQSSMIWVGMGGSDTVVQEKINYSFWNEGLYVNYGWSNTPLTVTASGAVITVNYTASAAGTAWNSGVPQAAGIDSLSWVTGLGDTRYADNIDLSGQTENGIGSALNNVNLTTGNDTVVGNGDTVLGLPGFVTSNNGLGINVTLAGASSAVLDMTHLSLYFNPSLTLPMGRATISKVDDIRATHLNDTLIGGGYDDFESFAGKGGNDSINGGSGYDRADYRDSNSGVHVDLGQGLARPIDFSDNSIGNDTLRSIEAIRGSQFGDVYDARSFGLSGSPNVGSGVFGRADGNSFEGVGGDDTIYGNGSTRVDYINAAVGVDVDLQRGTSFALGSLSSEPAKSVGTDTFSEVSKVRGSSLGDKLSGGGKGMALGDSFLESFEPGPGNDTIDGRSGGDEVIYSTAGWKSQRGVVIDMTITTGPQVTEDGYGGKDTLTGIEIIGGSDFDDNIKGSTNNAGLHLLTELFIGNKGNDTLNGGAQGYDEAVYTSSPAAITINLSTGLAQDGWGNSDTLISIEGIEGSAWNDVITGDAGNNRLDGRGGNDTLDGGSGTDWVEYNNATGAVTVNLGAGSASGAAGTDVLTGFENVQGSIYNDSITGSTAANVIEGLDGNDTLSSGDGDDTINGGLGDDRFYGGGGNDRLDGGPKRNLWWTNGSPGDFDTAYYDDLSAPVALNLSNLQVSGTSAGLDTLISIESIQTTGGADSITGSLAARDPNHSGFQVGLSWAGMGGSDTVVQDRANYTNWMDSLFANYGWSNAAINATSSGAVVTVSYGASSTGKTFWNSNVNQAAGTDTLTQVTSLGDTRFTDVFDLSGLTDGPSGNPINYVSITTGDDTITGNGDTIVNISSGWRAKSSSGAGVNVALPGIGTQVWDLSHLNWEYNSTLTTPMGKVTVSKIDDIRATDFNDTLIGGGYDDWESFRGKAGNDSIDGRSGYDRADYLGSNTGVYVDLGAGIARAVDSLDGSIGTDTLRSIEAIRGTAFNDVYDARTYGSSTALNVGNNVFGLSNGNSFDGRSGNDIIYGNGSTRIDYLSSAVGVDVDLLRGSAFALGDPNSEAANSVGIDSFSGVFRARGTALNDKLSGGSTGRAYGSTVLELFEPGAGNDTVDGRGGWDEVYYGFTNPNQGLVVDLNITTGPQVINDGTGGQDTLIGIEAIGGTAFADSFKGRDDHSGLAGAQENFAGYKGNDTIDGRGGFDEVNYIDDPAGVTVNLGTGTATDGWGNTDTLVSIEGVEGSAWNDAITGDSGNNRLDGWGGNDTLDGGAGIDWVEYNNATGAVTVNLGAGSASGAAGTDVLTGFENAQGSIYNDSMTGSSADNVLEGLEGNDTLTGGDGADTLLGGEGNDRFYGQAGNDLLDGGPRRNVSWGTGTGGDHDIADYNSLTAAISLNLTTLVLSGSTIGSDTLHGIEEVRATKLSDTVTGSFGLRTISASDAQTGMSWVGLGGNDNITQSAAPMAYWADSIYVDYAWSATAVQATATAADKIAVSYGSAQAMYWYGGAQNAGTDQLTLVSSIGDSRWADNIDLSQFSTGMTGSRRNYVAVTSGDDTVKGNGDTALSLLSSSSTTSSTGAGVSVTLPAAGQSGSIDARHLSWQPLSSSTERANGGLITISGIDEVRGTAFNDTLTGGAYDDYEAFRGRAGDDLIDGGSGYDMADYLGSTAGVHVLMAEGIARSTVAGDTSIGTDTLRGIEAIRGTNFNDIYDARGFGQSHAANVGSALNLLDGNSFEGRGGNDQIIGNGTTRIDYQGAAVGVNVDLARGTAFALGDINAEAAKSIGFDSFSGVFRVRGTTFGDQLTGGSAGYAFGSTLKEAFQPGAGNDTVDGKDGWDDVYYGDGGTKGVVIDMTITTGPQVTEDGFGGKDTLIGIEHISGGDFADSIKGSLNNAGLDGLSESFSGGKGNDTIDGGNQGYDEAVYGADPAGVTVNLALGTATDGWGNTDTLISIEGVEGSNFNDSIVGSSGDNRLDGRGGNDTLDGGAGQDWAEFNNATGGEGVKVDLAAGRATGGQGTDTLISIEHVQGTIYDDKLYGDDQANILQGMAGDDSVEGGIVGGGGNDTLLGGEGNDWLRGDAGNDSIDGGSGGDVVFYEGAATGIHANLATGVVSNDGQGGQDTLVNVENIHGSYYADTITLGASEGYVFARAGNDTLVGGSGNQNFIGGSGSDSIDGGAGWDLASYYDDGYDTAGAAATLTGVIVDLQAGLATDNWGITDILKSIENASGSAYADHISGDYQNNWLGGNFGDDTLIGNAGNDYLAGNAGDDVLSGGEGWDTARFDGLRSEYTVTYNADGSITVKDNKTDDWDDGTDTLTSIEQIVFADTSIGGAPNSTVSGTSGDDRIEGTAGNNRLDGKEGNDTLLGLGGQDTLIGGSGNDIIDGGEIKDLALNSDSNHALYFDSAAGINANLQTGIILDGLGGTDTVTNVNNLWGSAHGDLMVGTSGLERGESFFGGKGNDTIDGGALGDKARGVEFNSVSYNNWLSPEPDMTSGVSVDLRAGTASSAYYGNDVLINIQGVNGTKFNDVILGDDDNYLEVFSPGEGNDTIDGRGGINNNVNYNFWSSTPGGGGIIGNLAEGWVKKMPETGTEPRGIDQISNIQGLRGSGYTDQLIGGNRANDGFERFLGYKGNDTIDGGTGYDRVDHHTSPAGVTVQLSGDAEGWAEDGYGTRDVLRNIEAVGGSSFDDLLMGTDSAAFESFEGLWGDDTIDGRGGVDRLDLLRSGAGTVVVLGLNQADGYAIDGQIGFSTGESGRDLLRGIENVRGSIFNDNITGNEQANKLEGQAGQDTLTGGAGPDTLIGGADNDSLSGGDGDDTAVFSGNRADYTFNYTGEAGQISGADGTDQLSSIEFLQFNDQTVRLKGDTVAPKVQSTNPASGSTEVPVDANFVVSFDEPIILGTGNLTVSFGGQSVLIPANSPQVQVVGQNLIINPDTDLLQGTLYSVGMAEGFVTDAAGNKAAAVNGFTFTTSQQEVVVPEPVMVELKNLELRNNLAKNTAEITFDISLASNSYDGAKVTGLVIDLDYDASLVSSEEVAVSQYTKYGDSVSSWSFVVHNLSGAQANGRLAMVAKLDPANPLIGSDGSVATITLNLNKALSAADAFTIGFANGKTQVITDLATTTVNTGMPQTVQGTVENIGALQVNLLGSKALAGVEFTRADAGEPFKSGADGAASFTAASDDPILVTPSKKLSVAEQQLADTAVGLSDAIAILKMIVGLPINTGSTPTSPYQIVAADFNQNGNVGLDDAIGVLKHVVGLPASTPALKFMDAALVPAGLTMDSYGADATKASGENWMSGKIAVPMHNPMLQVVVEPVKVVGVLTGDVNGDWNPTATLTGIVVD